MFKALTAIITLAASASVMAQGDVTLNSLAHDAATRASFNQMVKGHQLPAWVTTGGTEKSNQLSGVYSVVDEKTDQEKLTWLNVSDALSIDGKTVLFAALSGSLDNHPDAFNYP